MPNLDQTGPEGKGPMTGRKKGIAKTGNVVLAKFKKDQDRQNRRKKWDKVDDAVQAARTAYTGGYEPDENEKTVSFEKAVGDLVEVLQKIKAGELKLGGMGSDDVKIIDEG